MHFDQEHLSRVPGYVAHLRLPAAQVEDLRLSLRERLLVGATASERRISTYKGQAPLGKWLRVTAVRAALDHLRHKDEQTVELDAEAGIVRAIAKDNNPEIDFLLGRYQAEFKAAVRAAFDALPERDRGVLHMYYLGGLNTPAPVTRSWSCACSTRRGRPT